MLAEIGLADVDDLYAAVPAHLRPARPLDLPEAIPAEAQLVRHVGSLFEGDVRVPLHRCFRGGGCWPHAVPDICTEILDRAEFRTAYWGDQYSDHGKYQAFFEYASLMGELLDLDAVSLPTYDWGNAAAIALRMTARITGRRRLVLAGDIGPDRDLIIRNYCQPDLVVDVIEATPETGAIEEPVIDESVAGVYVELPSFLGLIDVGVPELCAQAHAAGALVVVGVDPTSLGVLAPPSAYGADIVCGDLQPLGAGLQFGGGLAGFIATSDDELYVSEYPTYLIGLTSTAQPGEHGFGFVAWERTSYVRREAGKDFAGTTTANCAIAAAVYLSLLGPAGIAELGTSIMERSRYAAHRLAELPGVTVPYLDRPFFKEIVVNFDPARVTVATVNEQLHQRGFLGGLDLSGLPGARGQSALVCVTEVHAREDIDALVDAIRDATRAGMKMRG
jgi:glycine dehydrogenase subunit 1